LRISTEGKINVRSLLGVELGGVCYRYATYERILGCVL